MRRDLGGFARPRRCLVGSEPASMVWFLGTKVAKLRGSVWAEQLQALGRRCNT